MTSTLVALGFIVVLAMIVGAGFVAFYTRATKEIAFIRTGFGGEKVFRNNGGFVFPVLHDKIDIKMSTLKIQISSSNDKFMRTQDQLHVNFVAQLLLRVSNDLELISLTAQSLGSRTFDLESLKDIMEVQCSVALNKIVPQFTLQELKEGDERFKENVDDALSLNLAKNGLELVAVSFESIEETEHQVKLERTIKFAPHQIQAGISILSYFSQIIQQKYPEADSSVSIRQEGNVVIMEIRTPEGNTEKIEKALDEYGLVVTGKKLPEDLLSNPLHIVELKNKLELSSIELRMTNELHNRIGGMQDQRIESLETEIIRLHQRTGEGMQNTKDLYDLLKFAIKASSRDSKVEKAAGVLIENISRGAFKEENLEACEAIEVIAENDPSLLGHIAEILKGAVSGAVADAASTSWLLPLISALPK